MFQGEGAYALVDGAFSNGKRLGNLRHLNLGWNCMGHGKKHVSVAKRLAALLKETNRLVHLDLSYNHFNASHCAILAQGVYNNHTLWGLHIDGNAGTLDADGFIRPFDDEENVPGSKREAEDVMQKVKLALSMKKRSNKQKARASKKKVGPAPTEGPSSITLAQIERKDRVARAMMAWRKDEIEQAGPQRAQEKLNEFMGHLPLPDQLRDHQPSGVAMAARAEHEWLCSLSTDVSEGLRSVYSGVSRCYSTAEAATSDPDVITQKSHQAEDIGDRKPGCQSCWLCGGWVEVSFVLKPLVNIEVDVAPNTTVAVHLSLDNFARPVPLAVDAGGQRWSGSRFVPPVSEPLYVFFQVGREVMVVDDLPRVKLTAPMAFQLCDGKAEAQDTSKASAQVVEVTEVNLLDMWAIADLNLRSRSMHVSTERQTMKDVLEYLDNCDARPRMLTCTAKEDTLTNKELRWSKASSVWAQHGNIRDDVFERSIHRCLESDWCLTRNKFYQWSQHDLEASHTALKDAFLILWSLYQHSSTVDRHDKDTCGVTSTVHESRVQCGHCASSPTSVRDSVRPCLCFCKARTSTSDDAGAGSVFRWTRAMAISGGHCARGGGLQKKRDGANLWWLDAHRQARNYWRGRSTYYSRTFGALRQALVGRDLRLQTCHLYGSYR